MIYFLHFTNSCYIAHKRLLMDASLVGNEVIIQTKYSTLTKDISKMCFYVDVIDSKRLVTFLKKRVTKLQKHPDFDLQIEYSKLVSNLLFYIDDIQIRRKLTTTILDLFFSAPGRKDVSKKLKSLVMALELENLGIILE